MVSKYFKEFDKKIVKKTATKSSSSQKAGAKKTTAKKAGKVSVDIKALKEKLQNIIVADLTIDSLRPIDSEGFSPDGADLVVYRKYCGDIIDIMNGYVPYELLYGTFFVVPEINKKTLPELLNRVMTVKKLNRFSSNEVDDIQTVIPAFIISFGTDYSLLELKNEIINYYLANNVKSEFEFDLLMISNIGTVVKNWREGNFIALETKEDTGMWFFILMNEYLESEREIEIDFRKYVKKDIVYNEY